MEDAAFTVPVTGMRMVNGQRVYEPAREFLSEEQRQEFEAQKKIALAMDAAMRRLFDKSEPGNSR